ncbi:helix-turn-helix domain-containing protein [Fontimonas sp. SYSU GA230001]|uniref:helix-turn-helix domain-containing protein n=1 Tax=Fontimonas sp. SYSU GA230001 TaxID=3142450 RepID=UPI0032B47CBD
MGAHSVPFDRCKPNCSMCPAGSRCFTSGLPDQEISLWNDLVQTHVPLFPGHGALFNAGDEAENLYLVRAGCVKTYTIDEEGNERIRGFHLPGDLIGLDALSRRHHPCAAGAVEASQVCVIPRARVAAELQRSPALMQRLLERTSRELSAALSLSGDFTADQRVAAFVLSMQERLAPSASGQKLRLPMTRRDIGNYLRLATETVCRVITRLEQQGVLESRDRALAIRDRRRLAGLAEPVGLSGSGADYFALAA